MIGSEASQTPLQILALLPRLKEHEWIQKDDKSGEIELNVPKMSNFWKKGSDCTLICRSCKLALYIIKNDKESLSKPYLDALVAAFPALAGRQLRALRKGSRSEHDKFYKHRKIISEALDLPLEAQANVQVVVAVPKRKEKTFEVHVGIKSTTKSIFKHMIIKPKTESYLNVLVTLQSPEKSFSEKPHTVFDELKLRVKRQEEVQIDPALAATFKSKAPPPPPPPANVNQLVARPMPPANVLNELKDRFGLTPPVPVEKPPVNKLPRRLAIKNA